MVLFKRPKMTKEINIWFCFLVAQLMVTSSVGSRVLELSDRFLEVKDDGIWLIKFYAPWCGYCKRLEPVFNHVAQALHDTEIRVGKIDCTRFPAVGKAFGVDGLPTIMLLKEGKEYVYEGDRTTDDIASYAKRLAGPEIKIWKGAFKALADSNSIFFAYIGELDGDLWAAFNNTATKYQAYDDFYILQKNQLPFELTNHESSVFAWKDGSYYFFEDRTDDRDDSSDEKQLEAMTFKMRKWYTSERFPKFMKITKGNFNQILASNKFIALAVCEEDKLGNITPEMSKFKSMMETVVSEHYQKYREKFQFGWCSSSDIANSVAMTTLPLPSLLVINSTTFHHHIPRDDPLELTAEAVVLFLDDVLTEKAIVYGGNSIMTRGFRAWFQARKMLVDMWTGNWILTCLVFGLPLGFLSLICYSIFFGDIMDASEEEESPLVPQHEKKE